MSQLLFDEIRQPGGKWGRGRVSGVALACPDLELGVEEGIATICLRRPSKRNAVTAQMWQAITAGIGALAERDDVRLLVVRGSSGVFCAGADLASVMNPDGTRSESFHLLAVEALSAIASFSAPSVAVVEGPCIGGGVGIALACDFRFADEAATFAVPAVRHGIVYPEQSLARLLALLGPSRAARFMYTAEKLDAAAACSIGLVDECTSDLDGLLTSFADQIRLGDPQTVSVTRNLLRGMEGGAGRE